MAGGYSDIEARIRRLEAQGNAIVRALDALSDKVGKLGQDQRMARQPTGSGRSGGSMRRAVVTTAIPVAPDADSVSDAGRAKIRARAGTDLAEEVANQKVYGDWSVEIPAGSRILVEPDGDGWILVAVDYCPAPPAE